MVAADYFNIASAFVTWVEVVRCVYHTINLVNLTDTVWGQAPPYTDGSLLHQRTIGVSLVGRRWDGKDGDEAQMAPIIKNVLTV